MHSWNKIKIILEKNNLNVQYTCLLSSFFVNHNSALQEKVWRKSLLCFDVFLQINKYLEMFNEYLNENWSEILCIELKLDIEINQKYKKKYKVIMLTNLHAIEYWEYWNYHVYLIINKLLLYWNW